MIKKIITIVLPILVVTAAIFVFGLKVYQDSFNKFQYDGYVIGTDSGKESFKYSFSKEEKYKVNETKGEVAFKDNEQKDIVVPETTFVHYMDGSISTFKKAVVLNMANVKSDSLQYYNVFNGSVFTKTTEGYQIQYLEQTLTFNNFLVKISDSKYMLVGKDLTINYGDQNKKINDGYLEINYLDGNIVRIENQDWSLQNISDDIAIENDGVKLDLLNKKIIYNEETKVDLGEITIDSDDNIEIIPDDDNTKIMEEKEQENKNEISDIQNQPVVAPGVDVSGMESGIIDTSVEKVEQIVNDNKKIPDAQFKINAFEVKPNLMSTNITIEDEEGVLKGDVTVKIIDTTTNEEICKRIYTYGSNIGDYNCTALSPGRNYLLIAHSKYEKRDVTYEKDFVQRTFITPTAGISIEKDYVATDEISFKVNIKDESEVTKFDYIVIDSAEGRNSRPIASGTFERDAENNGGMCNNVVGSDSSTIASEEDDEESGESEIGKINECYVTVTTKDSALKANKKYSLILTNIQSKNVVISNYEIYKTESTLKEKPQYSGTTAIVNKLSSKFVIYLNNLQDLNNSVVSYRADIYDEDTGAFISSYETSASNQIEIPVGNHDQAGIIRGERYIAEMFIKYYDNEKEYEKYIGFQNLGMDSLEAPKVTFEESYVSHDRIKGNVIITDEAGTIITGSNIVVKMTNQSDGKKVSHPAIFSQADRNKNYISIPIDFTGLKQNSSYLFEVEATINFGDQVGDKQNTTTNIGAFVVNTITPASLRALWRVNSTEGTDDGAFSINFVLSQSPESLERKYKKTEAELKLMSPEEIAEYDLIMKDLADYEIKTLETLTFRIRKENAVIKDNSECTADNQCWLLPFRDVTLSGANHFEVSEIKDKLYSHRTKYDGEFDINDIEGQDYKIKFTPKNKSNEEYAMFNITDELQFATYIIEVVQSTDYTEYQNPVTITNPWETFTPNSTKKEPIIENGYFTESVIYETREDNKQYRGYQIIPKINQKSIPTTDGVKALLDFEYFLINLNTNEEISLNQLEANSSTADKFLHQLNDGTYGIAFYVNDYNKAQNINTKDIKQGIPYGLCYKVNVYDENNGVIGYQAETSDKLHSSFGCTDSDRAFKQGVQWLKGETDIRVRLKKTEQDGRYTKLTFDYSISSESSIYNQKDVNGNDIGKVLKYKTQSTDPYDLAWCVNKNGETTQKDCLNSSNNPNKEFFINILSSGSLLTMVEYKLLEESASTIPANSERYVAGIYKSNNPTNDFPVSNIIDPLEAKTNKIKYEIDQSDEKNTKFIFMGTYYSQNLKNYVAGVKIYMYVKDENGKAISNTKTLLYKKFDNFDFINDSSKLPTITVGNDELVNLQEQENVIIEIDLLYDRNFYGFEQEGSGPFAISSRLGNVYRYDDLTKYPNSVMQQNIFTSVEYYTDTEGTHLKVTPDKISKTEEASAAEIIDIKHNAKGKYYNDIDNRANYIQVARLSSYRATCNVADKCKLNVKLTDPVFLMEETQITKLIGKATFKFDIIKNAKVKNMVLKQDFYKTKYTKITLEDGTEDFVYRCDKNKKMEYISGRLYSFEDQPVEGTTVISKIQNTYEITENMLPYDYDHLSSQLCTVFTWSGDFVSTENDDGTETIVRKEDQSFAYSGVYEANPYNPQDREYVFEVLAEDQTTSTKVEYDTGTEQYIAGVSSPTQDVDFRRTMSFTVNFQKLEEADYFDFGIYIPDYLENGQTSFGSANKVKIPIDRVIVTETMREQKKITGSFSLDQIIGEDGNPIELQPGTYGLRIIPYRECVGGTVGNTIKDDEMGWNGEDPSENTFICKNPETGNEVADGETGIQRLRSRDFVFSYDIIPAAVRITRTESKIIDPSTGQPKAGTFGIVLTVDDKYRSVGNYACANCEKDENGNVIPPNNLAEYQAKSPAAYNIKVQTAENTFVPLENMPLESHQAFKIFEQIDIDVCVDENGNKTDLCNIIVEYYTDTDNVEFTPPEYQEYKKSININIDSDLGIISAVLATNKVTLNFSSFYKPWRATKYTYTMTQDNTTTTIGGEGETGFTPTNTSDVLTMPITLKSTAKKGKSYTFFIKFKDDDDNQIGTWQVQGLSF